MKYRMRYAYYDLGEQEEGSTAVIRLSGSTANVILVDAENFARYKTGQKFLHEGGMSRRSPVELEIPRDGHWYVVVDLGGRGGRTRATVSLVDRDGEPVPLSTEGVEDESEVEEAEASR